MGALEIAAGQPVASLVLRQTHTSRGENLIMAIPPVETLDSNDGAVIAGLSAGGGRDTEIVLVNPRDETVSGHIEVFEGRTGQAAKWSASSEGLHIRFSRGPCFT